MKRIAKAIIGIPESRSAIEKMEIKGIDPDSGKQVPLDLLADRLVVSEGIIPEHPRTRVLRCNDVYDTIERGERNLHEQLVAASGGR